VSPKIEEVKGIPGITEDHKMVLVFLDFLINYKGRIYKVASLSCRFEGVIITEL